MTEYLHPGVYIAEVPFDARPIEGVSTSGGAPAWTDANVHDPATTLLEFLCYGIEPLEWRAERASSRLVSLLAGGDEP